MLKVFLNLELRIFYTMNFESNFKIIIHWIEIHSWLTELYIETMKE